MSGRLTREEYNKYLKTKAKLDMKDACVQTDEHEESTKDKTNSSETKSVDDKDDSTTEATTEDEDDNETSKSTDTSDDESNDGESSENEPKYKKKPQQVEIAIVGSNKRKLEREGLKKVKEFFQNLKKRRYTNEVDEQYYRGLKSAERKEIRGIEDKLYNTETSKVPLRFKILGSNMDSKLKAICVQRLDQLDSMQSFSDEYFKLLQWIESVAKLPLGKYKRLPISAHDDVDSISRFLNDARYKLDSNVYGHHDTKEHIIRLLAKWISNKDAKGLVIGLEGPAGCGKTSICLEICHVLGLPSGFISLGGLSSSDYLVGHSYTYEGSKWGKIAEILMYSEYTNPVIFFDELDKVSTTRYGEEIINTLIHVTDVTQNHNFRDKYFSEVPLDLSKCIIIFSYNNGELVNPILKDRMVTIKASGYNNKDKIQICKKHMLPKILQEYAFKESDMMFDDDMLQYIIHLTEEEEGVRRLKRSLEDIISQLNVMRLLKQKLSDKDEDLKFPLKITESIAKRFVTKKELDNYKLNMMYM